LRHGGLIYRTHSIGFVCVRNATGHTWDASIEYFAHDPRTPVARPAAVPRIRHAVTASERTVKSLRWTDSGAPRPRCVRDMSRFDGPVVRVGGV
jgi:hypothetical protein